MSSSTTIRCRLNGREIEELVPIRMTVVELLRERLALTGTKVSCELQVCGVCTVLVDERPVSSCSMLACDLDGREVVTIEGLSRGRDLHPLQEAFAAANALQCGFCTPGFIMMAAGLLALHAEPSSETTREWLDGNLCRCTGYAPIETAVAVATGQQPAGGEQ